MNQSKIKTLLTYQLRDYRKTILIMYLCVYLVTIAFLVFGGTSNSGNSPGGSFELASMITIFVVGLNSFKENFKFFSANGVSRKTQLCSTAAALGILSVIFALIDTINGIIFSHIMVYRPMLIQAYGPRYGYELNVSAYPVLTPQILAEDFLWLFCSYLFISVVGLCITTLYYRMNKGLKIAVSVAVPVLLLNGLPAVDKLFLGSVILKSLTNAARTAWGISNGYNPYIAMLSMLILTAVFTVLAYLLARKASIKK